MAFTLLCQANSPLENLRTFFFKAENEAGIKAFRMYALTQKSPDALTMAYQGTAIAMGAKYTDGITEKIRVFNEGKDLIEKAVKNAPANAEIRFLRYCVQANIPGILGYSGQMNEDFSLIHADLSKQNLPLSPFWQNATKTMLKCEKIPASHIEKLNKFEEK